jgi:cation diffusion facilitator CzcD-associated flavoprotein CzcO
MHYIGRILGNTDLAKPLGLYKANIMDVTSRKPSVLIIGAGMTGILMVIKLRKAGIEDITVLEKKERIGGTWRENTYPGVACDVPAHMYTYSFELNPNWSHFFAHGDEIQGYFEGVADKYDVNRCIRFNEAVTDARYENNKWQVTSSQNRHYEADFVVCATGILHHPAFPNIKGLENFKGEMFHTAQWNHDQEIGPSTKVGVIGTGSTACQSIPELVDSGADVSVFQRTPQWVLPLKNFRNPDRLKKLMNRFPSLARLSRNFSVFFMEHFFTKAVTGHFVQKHLISWWCKLNLLLSIKDKALREKLRPNYQVGCKRIVVNTTYYKAIQKPNAHLITENIECITEDGVRTKDGVIHKLDVLVLSTGFHPMNYMRPMNLIGRADLHIDDAWSDQIKTYRSMMMPNYPNFFLMHGPNTPIGNFSVIAMSEVQCGYILKMIEAWQRSEYDEAEATPEAVQTFNAYIKDGLKGTAWVGGCQSWYLDKKGDPILWPYTWGQWVKEMREPEFSDMRLTKYQNSQSKEAA